MSPLTPLNAQLLVFVSFDDEAKGEFVEDVLGLTNLSGHTRGQDIYKAIMGMLNERAPAAFIHNCSSHTATLRDQAQTQQQ